MYHCTLHGPSPVASIANDVDLATGGLGMMEQAATASATKLAAARWFIDVFVQKRGAVTAAVGSGRSP